MTNSQPPVFIPGNTITMADSYVVNSDTNTVAALFEMDLTDVRHKLQQKRKNGENIAITAWIVKLMSAALEDHNPEQKLTDFNYAMWLEKEFDNQLYTVPVKVNNASTKSIEDISKEIGYAKGQMTQERNFLKQNKSHKTAKYLLYLPHILKKILWRLFIRNPRMAYQKIGNGAFSYISTTGNYKNADLKNAHKQISMGISSMFQKPRLIDYDIKMRDIVPVTVLINKDLMKNQDATAFIKDIAQHINNNAAFI